MKLKVAIIGKPNVGKSTLFNKLCGRRLAITHDRPGVTRDSKISSATLGNLEFDLVDTAGLDKSNDDLTQKMFASSIASAQEADVIIFMIDGRNGVNSDDRTFADKVRKLSKPVIVVVNKAENPKIIDQNQVYKLGFKDIVFLSAEHKLGFADLEEKLVIYAPKPKARQDEEVLELKRPNGKSINFAIIGRPNAGKSTLFNKLLGFERTIVSDVSGTTRDAISHTVNYKGQDIELIDTAGLRRKASITDSVEQLSTVESINAIRRSHLVALVIDGTCPLEKQDFSILRVAINEGRGVILIINKFDLIKDHKAYKLDIEEYVAEKMFELKGLPIIYTSALKDTKFDRIWLAVTEVMGVFNRKISTGTLNQCLDRAVSMHIPPLASNGRRIRLKYVTQTASRPPTFTIFGNMVSQLPDSYIRYLYNSIREAFSLFGVPIRLKCKSGANPYEGKVNTKSQK
jgi:GTP-binding protein